jgi:hypothetical protein
MEMTMPAGEEAVEEDVEGERAVAVEMGSAAEVAAGV